MMLGFRVAALLGGYISFTQATINDIAPQPPPPPSAPRALPAGKLIVGYAFCGSEANALNAIAEAVKGVNVLIWFSTSLSRIDPTTGQANNVGPNHTCVAQVAKELRARQLPTAHMISIGGWDAPHPNTTAGTGAQWATAWQNWNADTVAQPALGFPGYDGVDWDLEGNDRNTSAWNTFTVECMELVGTMSQQLKSAGFLVSLVPPQSYIDVEISKFDRVVLHAYPDFHPDFAYHGWNVYCLWLSKHGRSTLGGKDVPTFDFVDVQLYESFSRAAQALESKGTSGRDYLVQWTRAIIKGWTVDFASDPAVGWPSSKVAVPASQLVVGFSHGSAALPHSKSIFFPMEEIAAGYNMLEEDERPLGFMFWNCVIDGGANIHGKSTNSTYPNGTSVNVSFAGSFNQILKVRKAGGYDGLGFAGLPAAPLLKTDDAHKSTPNPKANPKNVVVHSTCERFAKDVVCKPDDRRVQWRFSFLTESMVRIERSSTAEKPGDDRSTLAVINRFTELPNLLKVEHTSSTLRVQTPHLLLSMNDIDGLKIDIQPSGQTWKFGEMNSSGSLNGTFSDLDCYSTPSACVAQYEHSMGSSLISRDGWAVVDDVISPRWTPAGNASGAWPSGAPMPEVSRTNTTDDVDLYFLGYGLRYKVALADWATVSGKMSMPPASAFGVWWSRYYNYSQAEIISEVLTGYKEHNLPLNRLVLDMDWHIEDKGTKERPCSTWGGTTWNKNLFPSPTNFISWLNNVSSEQTRKVNSTTFGHPLPLTLNVHPQGGIDHCQSGYARVAKAMNVTNNSVVECDMFSSKFAAQLFALYDDPDNRGVATWWTDYQGCGTQPNRAPDSLPAPDGSKDRAGIPRNASLLWSNAIYDSHIRDVKNQRPMVLSRDGGYGNQRYPITFSGDTFQAWGVLDFQIRATSQAANTLAGYWSHDIGGFHNGGHPNVVPGDANVTDAAGAELLLRWMQFGVVAPIFRTHCNHCERRIWLFPHKEELADAMRLRNALGPYVYTAARHAYDRAVSILRPMYYEDPELNAAYDHKQQYYFGRAIIASPISERVDEKGRVTKSTWLPSSPDSGHAWCTWDGSVCTRAGTGPSVHRASYSRAEVPLFLRAGALLPMKTMADVQSTAPGILVWMAAVNPSSGVTSGHGEAYEDGGENLDYESETQKLYSKVSASWTRDGNETLKLTVHPTVGGFKISKRKHVFQLRGLTCANGHMKCTARVKCTGSMKATAGTVAKAEATLSSTAGAVVVTLSKSLAESELATCTLTGY